MRTVFDVGFYAAATLLISGAIHMAIRTKYVRLPVRVIGVLAHWVVFGATIAAFIVRYRHSGKVCSGDYLADDEASDGYLTD